MRSSAPLLLATLLVAAPTGRAWAAPPDPTSSEPAPEADEAEPPRTVVLMIPELSDERDEAAAATLRAHLEALEIAVVVERYSAAEIDLRRLFEASAGPIERADARGILWVELGPASGDPAALYVLEREDEQIYGRRVEGEGGPAVVLESLANVVAMAAVALVEGRAIRWEPEPPEQPELPAQPKPGPEPEPEPPPSGRVELVDAELSLAGFPRLRGRVGYRGYNFSPELPWVSTAQLGFGANLSPRVHVELSYELAPPVSVAREGLRVSLSRFPIGLGGGGRFELRDGWFVELSGRASLEPTVRRTRDEAGVAEPTGADLRVFAGLEVEARAGLALRPDLRLWLGLGLAGVLLRANYTFDERVLIAPHPVRILAGAGLTFDALRR